VYEVEECGSQCERSCIGACSNEQTALDSQLLLAEWLSCRRVCSVEEMVHDVLLYSGCILLGCSARLQDVASVFEEPPIVSS
jgi:hypothetical protein